MAQQIKKKFIGNDQVGSNQVLIEKDSAVRGTLQDNSVVDLLKLNSSDEVMLKGIKVLDSSGLIPSAILPSFVDDVLEFADLASFPATGESGKIYVALDTNKQYRWSGSTYVQITSGAVDSVNGETGIVVLSAGDIQMDSEATSVETKLVNLQNEVDAIETGAGLNTDGTYSANAFSPIISAATSLKQADDYLDLALQNVITLSGVALNDQDLGSFTGSTIADAQTIKQALQALETAHEEVDQNANDLISLSGVAENAVNLGSFTGSTIADNQTVKSAFQDLETAHEEVDQNANDLISLSGVSENSVNLGSFTGSTIADNQTIKAALQDLETAHENHLNDSVDAHDASAISVSPAVNGQTDVQSALEDHESRIDAIETALQPTWARIKFDLSAGDISNGYVNLPHEAIGESIHAFVDRLAIHQGEDFTISVVSGVTRITFAGDLVSPGQSQLDANDNIYVRYQYLA